MDKPGKNVADNDRYAFLLGSALRNNDSEQFFCIYDSILPGDLSEIQLDKIKEQARYIADLPEDDFNDLVVNARDFSLAQGRLPLPPATSSAAAAAITTMSATSSPHTCITIGSDFSDEEDEGVGARVRSTLGSAVPPLCFDKSPILASAKGSAATMTDDDSGLPSSTKTERHNSSSEDTDTSDIDAKGAFDYFPLTQRKREAVSIHHTYNPHYDEEVAVESDKSSVESPRSDTSSTREYDVTQLDVDDSGVSVRVDREMTTFSQESRSYHDHDDDSDDNIHRKLYGRTSVGSSTRADDWESIERPRAFSASSISFTRSQSALSQGQPISSLRGASRDKVLSVDDPVLFPSLSAKSHLDRSSPPFPPDEHFMTKMGESVSKLVCSNSYNLCQPVPGEGLTDTKKKKKKKKDAKDESGGHPGKHMTTDVNGNPLDTKLYRSMRGPPSANENSSLITHGSASYGTANHDSSSGRDGHGPAKSDDGSSPGGAGSGPGDKRKNKKQRKPEVTARSEDIQNFVGDISNIDQLVSFINSDITEKKLIKFRKEGGGLATPNAAATSPAVTTAKTVKKGKDRNKTKHSLTSGIGDAHDSSLTPASETQQALSLPSDSSITPPGSALLGLGKGSCSPERASKSSSQPTDTVSLKASGEMGGSSSTSGKVAADEEQAQETCAGSASQPSQAVFKNHHCVSEKEVANAVSSPAKAVAEVCKAADSNKNHKNLTISSATKADTAPKKEQASDVKDSKDKNKTKNVSKDGGKVSTPDNNLGKKSKTKTSKNDVKTEGSHNTLRSRSSDGSSKTVGENEKGTAKTDEMTKDVITPKSLVPTSPNTNELSMDSGDFIFTDVDLPRVEDEFTVVSKKKKRSPAQAPNHGQSNSPSYGYHYSRDSQYQSSQNCVPYTRNGPRDYRPPPTKTRSCTPPPFSSSETSETTDKSRDLSPSAFPTLHRTTRTPAKSGGLSKDGRRRSLEELSLDTGQLLGYDSDKESVKSLPAAQVRGAYPVSYASMVATPRPSVDSSKAESVCSSSEGGGCGEWQSPVVWKGREGHERRHSIGSSPKDMAKTAGSPGLQGSRPRSGSQETLSRDATKDPVDKEEVVGLPAAKCMCQSDSANSFADNLSGGSDVDSARGGSEAGSEPSDVFVPTITPPAAPVDNKKVAATPGNKTNTIPGAVPSAAPQQTVASQGQTGIGRNPASSTVSTVKAKGHPAAPPSRSQTVPVATTVASSHPLDAPCKVSVSVAKPVNNGRKKTTSVIFLDKRFDEKPRNLDITFGFDLSDSPVEASAIDNDMDTKDKSASSEAADNSQVPPVAVSAGNMLSVTDKSSSVSSLQPHTSQPTPSSQVTSSLPAPGKDSNQLNRPPKGPHIAGLNGLVLPQRTEEKPATAGPAPATVRSPPTSSTSIVSTQPSEASSDSKAPTSSAPESSVPQVQKPLKEAPPQVPLPDGCLALKLGEGLASVAQGNGKTRQIMVRIHKGLDTSGTFNLAEAAGFLYREWSKIEKLKEKDSAAVQVYSSK